MSQELLNWLIGLGSFVVALWLIRKPLAALYRAVIMVHDTMELLSGDGDHPGLDDRLSGLEAGMVEQDAVLGKQALAMEQQSYTLGELRHELKPNGGSSMNDRLTRVEKHLNPDAPDNR